MNLESVWPLSRKFSSDSIQVTDKSDFNNGFYIGYSQIELFTQIELLYLYEHVHLVPI